MLYFRHLCVLAAVAGVLAFRHPGPGFVFLGLIWLLDLPRSGMPGRTALLVSAFAGAVSYAALREPSPPDVPAWLAKASAPAQLRDGEKQPPATVRIRGLVCSSTPLSGNRLRLVLEKIVPANLPEVGDAASSPVVYQGRVVWTWYRPGLVPLPGQMLEASLRLSPVRGMKNPGLWDSEQYWHERNVWFRAGSGANADVHILPSGASGLSFGRAMAAVFAQARRALFEKFLAALPQEEAQAPLPSHASISASAAFLPALLFGDRSFLSREQSDVFTRATLMHSLALSGLHLGYAVLLGLLSARGIGRCVPGLWLFIPMPAAALLLALPAAAVYLWLGQMPLSLVRAAVMLFFFAAFTLFGRAGNLLDRVLAAVAVLLALDPFFLFELSLQLSVLSITIIAISLPFLSECARHLFPCSLKSKFVSEAGLRPPGGRDASASGGVSEGPRAGLFTRLARGSVVLLGLSFCIQAALLPVTLRVFGSIGLCFPLNLIWLPVLSMIVMPLACLGLILSGIGMEMPASAVLHLASLPCEALMFFLHTLDAAGLLPAPLMPRPHWLSGAGFWVLCLGLAGLPRRRTSGSFFFVFGGLAMLLLPPIWVWSADRQAGVRLRLLDVGQGQAALIEWSGLRAVSGEGRPAGRVLIDGGGFAGDGFDVGGSIIAPILTDNALPRLNMILNTHPDTDHLSGLLYVLERFSVDYYMTNGGEAIPALAEREQAVLRRSGLKRRALEAGDRVTLAPDLYLETLWPDAAQSSILRVSGKEKGNEASLILRLVWRGKGLALLCGDAGAPSLRKLMAAIHKESDAHGASEYAGITEDARKANGPLNAWVLVLPHHGSAGAFVPGFYESVRPAVALASCGYANRWGFPAAAVQKALRALHIPLYDTAGNGQIQLYWLDPDAPPKLSLAREGEL
ncbi:MAG: ComEC/Rec2 family competence protein [Desulfovibrio sp.]|jgi:competence protein ComEC|nr:ComEC/Rec2 family competence protein [Desulfovibrio sp.]